MAHEILQTGSGPLRSDVPGALDDAADLAVEAPHTFGVDGPRTW
jgi:hypothetical protein